MIRKHTKAMSIIKTIVGFQVEDRQRANVFKAYFWAITEKT